MRDFAVSENAAVQAQLDRLGALTLPQGRFGLETITAILSRIGDPQLRLPPVFHVAGTNGKGSTCAYLRSILEAQGYAVHSATKPHLVRYNERIRLAGKLIADEELAALLGEVLDASEDLGPSFFEVTTAAMFLAFARHPADAAIVEVGLGGRFDATNVIPRPAVCGIAALGIDHEAFLLRPEDGVPQEPLARIAFEKASIARPGVALVTQAYPAEAAQAVAQTARAQGAELFMREQAWRAEIGETIAYADGFGPLTLPLPALPGVHQAENAALAVAMLRHQDALAVSPGAIAQGIAEARWPARLQKLGPGPLTARLPHKAVYVDGGHNPDAAQAIARAIATLAPVDLVFGLMRNRPVRDVLFPLAPHVRKAHVVPLQGHDHHDPRDVAMLAQAQAAPRECYPAFSLEQALDRLAADAEAADTLLIAGSLYLAGEALRMNGEIPE
ncbi:MAG: bifunctional folylpolyglutamate synthase/dihydrofolate synthase [Sphingomonadales bacterium]|nr:bifunctional folylpolyglutamate synthase/dihydrofolate synthase [Sphingomonadales bacterium]